VSDLFDDDPQDAPPRQPSNRTRWMVTAGVVVVLLFFGLTTFAGLYTDGLWYDALGYGSVFGTMFWTRLVLFLVFGLLLAVAVALPIALAYRSRPFFHPADDHGSLDRYRDAVTPIRTWLLVGITALIGIFGGVSGAGHWRTYLMWRHGGAFGREDPYFGRDIGFYVFDLPWWHYLVNVGMTAMVLALMSAAVVHYLYGGIRLSAKTDRFSTAAQVQLSVLAGVLMLLKGVDYWLDKYDLVHASGPLLDGIGYTDDNAVLPAKNILIGISVICAVLFLLNVWRRNWQLPSVGLSLMLVSAILLGLIWPAIVQTFQVNPSQSDKERKYLAANIDATREAYSIDDQNVKVTDYSETVDVAGRSVQQLDQAAARVPIVDPGLVQDEFEQKQQGRAYYTVAPTLDVDRYRLNGRERALVLGVRELKQSGISESDQTWTNLHTVYTHSNGVIAAYANQRDAGDGEERLPMQWAESLERDDLTRGMKIEDRIYFGEQSPSYSVVGRQQGAPPVELDLTRGEGQSTSTYDGAGGVSISSGFRRLMYAIEFGSANFVLSDRVNENSEVLYHRTPHERVEKVAPWLTLDDDAYPVVLDGRVQWVVDGYTTTDRYPLAAKDSFAAMTDDALQSETGERTLPTDEINYMRNAVKATVDAYDGTVTLYAWDESDPILQAWQRAFPGTVLPKDDIPADLMSHLRYPRDMYKVQRYQLARYHVTDALAFLNGNDRWSVPEDPNNSDHQQAPYRMYLDNGKGEQTWSLSSTFVPYERENLASIMSVDSDATSKTYGQITVRTGFDQQSQGPGQVRNAFSTDAEIANAVAQYSRSGGQAVWGNILTVPLARDGLLYVEPVYATRASTSASSYPTLAYVLVSYQGETGYGRTLADALEDAVGNLAAQSPGEPPDGSGDEENQGGTGNGGGSGGGGGGSVPQQVTALLDQAETLFTRADNAGKSGNYVLRERLLSQARAKVRQAADLLGG